MSYRTILVHFNDPQRAEPLAEAAVRLAQQHDAHLIGLHVIPRLDIHVAAEIPVGLDLLDRQREAIEEEAADCQKVFENTASKGGVNVDWRSVEAGGETVPAVVMGHGRCADLVICGQEDRDSSAQGMHNVPEDVMFGCGRPVLLLPYAGTYPVIGRFPVVGWDGSREAARAVGDAMPFLKRAEEVKIVTVNTQGTQLRGSSLPGTELASSLARHGVKCEASQTVAKDLSIADEILSRTADLGSDLLVMGGFGHSRIREYVLGGATRGILERMTLPVLMSH